MTTDNPTAKALLEGIQKALPGTQTPVQLHEPWFKGNEWDYVKECIDTGWVSSAGSYVDGFEAWIAEYTGAAAAVAVVNGTCAITAALTLNGVRPREEVLVPSLTFVATANAASHIGAIPHFVDVEPTTLGIDPIRLEEYLFAATERRNDTLYNKQTGRPITALVAVHIFGHGADIENIGAVCDKFGIPLIEDAAEALGSWRGNRHLGTFGATGILSFNGNKIITTGGGGALLFNDAEKAALAKHLTSTAKQPHSWAYIHDQVGYNFRMPNINAALGLAQAEILDDHLVRKRNLANRYKKAFSSITEAEFLDEPVDSTSNFWLNAVTLSNPEDMEGALEYVINHGYHIRPLWAPLHTLPMYTGNPRMNLPITEFYANRIINLPSGPRL